MRHYGNEEGLASEVVLTMAQTPDGLLWAGTEAGIVYFDGRRFEPFRGTLPSSVVTHLFADSDGTLWATTDGGVAAIRDRKAIPLGEAEGLPKASYSTVGRDGLGHLWVLGTKQLYIENGPMRFVKAPALPVPGRTVQIFTDPARTEVLAITARHILGWRRNRWTLLQGPPVSAGEEFLKVAEDGEEGVWLRTSEALWQRPKGGVWRRERANMTGGFSFSSRLDRDSQGWIWFDDADGLWRMKGNLRQRYGLPGEDAKGGLVDREGGLWIRTDHGVNRALGLNRWATYDTREGLPTIVTWQPVKDRLGRLWVGTDKGLCMATATGFLKVIPGRILTSALAPNGHIWSSGSPGGTLYDLDPATLRYATLKVGVLPQGRITAGLAVDTQGTPWVADRNGGLARGVRNGSGWSWTPVAIEGQTPRDIFGVVAMAEGGVIVFHDGIASLGQNGRWTRVPKILDELPTAVAPGPDGRLAFIYRNHALITFHRIRNGVITRTGQASIEGMGNNTLHSIFSAGFDPSGKLWVGTNVGLGLLPGQDASEFHLMGAVEDRPVSPECNEWSILAEAGKVWLGTTSGLASYNSGLPPPPARLDPPILLWARAGSLELDPEGPAPKLPRRFNELELKFLTPTYQVQGRIRYEAKLEGIDPDWVRLDEPHLRYAGLPAGRHSLSLRSTLAEGGAASVFTLHFTIIPAWWETLWARLLGMGILGAAVWFVFWLRHVALRSRNRQLQEEVARQTQALQEASRAKSAFLANMSHELRTPLNAILLYSELLQEEAKEKGLTSTTEDASRIRQAGSSLLHLIDDILDISKIEAGHVNLALEDIPLGPFLDRVDGALRPVVERNGNRFQVDGQEAPPVLHTDPVRLQQILANLLSNAAKFTENGEVHLRVHREDAFAVFDVEDTGIGMTQEEQARVFREFVQADSSTTRKYGGTGLGLTLVQRLTGLLGGDVGLQSETGVGTRVTIRIPIENPGPVR
jgi:signal transduction histidine kinase/ligand-binding sensor domain-containing protein